MTDPLDTLKTKTPRLITSDCHDLPPEFHVVTDTDPYEAVESARMAFMENPKITLVVWPDAPVFFDRPDESSDSLEAHHLRKAIKKLSHSVQHAMRQLRTRVDHQRFFSLDDEAVDVDMSAHFEKISVATRSFSQQMSNWQASTEGLRDILEEVLVSKKMHLATRFMSAAYDMDGTHSESGLRSDSVRVLRLLDGESTRFYGRDDVDTFGGPFGSDHTVLENAQPWIIKPWDVAFISQNVVHEAPGGRDEDRRLVEVFDVKSAEEFIASAQRPFLKRLLGKPAYERLGF